MGPTQGANSGAPSHGNGVSGHKQIIRCIGSEIRIVDGCAVISINGFRSSRIVRLRTFRGSKPTLIADGPADVCPPNSSGKLLPPEFRLYRPPISTGLRRGAGVCPVFG